MSRVAINTGSVANDGTGDSLRIAGGIINDNFAEIYSQFGDGTDLTPTWDKTAAGVNTTSNVGIGTTNPRFGLEVGAVGASGTSLWVNGNARVTGILTVGSSSIVLDGNANKILVGSGISFDGNTGIISATAFYAGGSIISGGGGGGGLNYWVSGATGITTTANVGVATNSAPSALTVGGNSLFAGIATFRNNVTLANLTSSSNTLRFGSNSYIDQSTSDVLTFQINTGTDSNSTDGSFVFRTTEPNTSPIPNFQLDALRVYSRGDYWNGLVRVYTDLHVDDNAFVGGDLQVGAASTLIGVGSTLGSFKVGAGGTVITTTSTGLVGIGTTNPVSGYNLTLGNDSSLGRVSNSLKVHGYGDINGLIIKGNSTTGTGPYYTDNVVITQHPASTFTGNRNVAIGDYSFTTPGAAGENVAIGYYALNVVGNNDTLNTWNGNTAIGAFAGQSATTTLRNTFIGRGSGRYVTTGNENTILGSYDGNQNNLDIRTSSNNVVLSDGAGNIRLYANSSGNVGIGTTNPTSSLTVKGNTSLETLNVSGVITATSFIGDGSGLTGVVGSGSGVVIQDNGSTVGTAGTIDFSTNLSVSPISAGFVTVTASGNGGETYWSQNATGINTTSNVGIGTTTASSALTVFGTTTTTNLVSTNGADIDGLQIAQDSLTGTGNIRIGDSNTLGSTTGGDYNIAIGQEALDNIRNGDNNIAIGYQVGKVLNASDSNYGSNVLIGYQSFLNMDAASNNVAVGYRSLYGTTSSGTWDATQMTSIGAESGYNLENSRFSSFFGYQSGYSQTSADYNTFLGYRSGRYITTGDSNVILGSYDGNSNGLDIRTSSNNVVISDGSGNIRLYANSSGDVGIRTTNPTSALTVQGDISGSGNVSIGNTLYFNKGNSSGIFFGTPPFDSGQDSKIWVSDTLYPNSFIFSNIDYGARFITSEVSLNSGSLQFVGLGTTAAHFGGADEPNYKVGIRTTNPTSALTVKGNTSLETLNVSGIATISGDGTNSYLRYGSSNAYTNFVTTYGVSQVGGVSLISADANGAALSADTTLNAAYWRIRTLSDGAEVNGNLTISGPTGGGLSVSGVSTLGTVQVSSGIITATSGIVTYYGDVSNAADGRWTLGANGTSDYTFTGIGFTQTTNDPVLYLARGRVYEFVNNSGGAHPFEIRVSNGGAAYSDGVTNNAAATGVIRFEIPFNAPNTLYYQCTNHSGMGNTISVYPSTI